MNNTQKKFGYIRVSTQEQNLDRQIEAMKEMGISERDIFADKQSGKDINRVQYQTLKQILRTGDTLVIKSIDRLGRNYTDIKNEWSYLSENGIFIQVIDMPILNTNNQNKDLIGNVISDVVLTLLGYVAQQEREFLKQRQAEGISAAKAKGIKFGRPKAKKPDYFDVYLEKVKKREISAVMAMKELNLKKTTFYKLMNLMNQ